MGSSLPCNLTNKMHQETMTTAVIGRKHLNATLNIHRENIEMQWEKTEALNHGNTCSCTEQGMPFFDCHLSYIRELFTDKYFASF